MHKNVCHLNKLPLSAGLLLAAVVLATSAVSSAAADHTGTKTDPSCGDNIFSTPGSESETPTFADERSGRGKMRELIRGEGRDAMPSFKQVRTIPSLTMVQRKEIHKIYGEGKAQAAPLMEQIKQLRGGGQNMAANTSRPNANKRAQTQQLFSQLRAVRTSTWAKVKANLTTQQLQELNSMRKGELKPATFNEPEMNSAGGE
jgi:hypothetical protein